MAKQSIVSATRGLHLTHEGISANSRLSPFDRLLAKVGIRPEDKLVTAMLFSNMLMSGIAIGMIRVCAFTLFLEHWKSDQLAIIAILIALVGMPMTLFIDRVTRGFGLRNYLFTLLGVILVGLAIMRLSLISSDSKYLIFTLPLFFELVYMMFSLQFVALLSRLLDVRQTKRLSGISRSGEFLAELVGGLLVIILLDFMRVVDLLFVAMLTTSIVFMIVGYTISHFHENLYTTHKPSTDVEQPQGLLGILRLPYVRLITCCYVAYMFAYFFLEVAFYDYASKQYPDEKMLATFIAQFYAIAGFLTMLTMIFLFAPFLRKFSIIAGIIAFPAVIFIGSSAVTSMEYLGFPSIAIFSIMVITNGLRIILQSAIWKNSVAILFQVMPDSTRGKGVALTEGVIDPVAGGLAGIGLYLLTTKFGLEPSSYLLILSILMLAWIVAGFTIRRLYLSNLMLSIQKRKLGVISLSDLDNASLDTIKAGLKSQYPAEVFYCINLLEAIEYPGLTGIFSKLLDNPSALVRINTLQRIGNNGVGDLKAKVSDHMERDSDPVVRGQALKTYAKLSSRDTKPKLIKHLATKNQELRKGALIGLLTFDSKDQQTTGYLYDCSHSKNPDERIFAADVIGEVGNFDFTYLLNDLLEDTEIQVVERAILGAGKLRDPQLTKSLLNKLSIPALLGPINWSLKQIGENTLHQLDIGLGSGEKPTREKLQMIETIREIGGENSINILLQHTQIHVPELRHQTYLGLATLHYQADDNEKSRFLGDLEKEVKIITWLIATINDISTIADYGVISAALRNELATRTDVVLLILSFLFPSIAIKNARSNINSKTSQNKGFALELLDNLLTKEVKRLVLPILEDLTIEEKLDQMSIQFPQEKMAPAARFNDIVERHYELAFSWTRSCIAHQIGKERLQKHVDQIIASLNDRESIVRETAIWSLSRLSAPGRKSLLEPLLEDTSASVSSLAQNIYRTLPDVTLK